MLVRRRKKARRTARGLFPGHRQWIRGCECIGKGKAGHICEGKMEAAHWRQGTDGGASKKPSDWWCFPACEGLHLEQHRGDKTFVKKYGFKMKEICMQFAKSSPHWFKMKEEMENG